MTTVYVYALNQLADWETGYVLSELHSGRFFKKDAPSVSIKTVTSTNEAITTMGGMIVQPNCAMREVVASKQNLLILPGADSWDSPQHHPIIERAQEFVIQGGTVAAICGATVALSHSGLLNDRLHTSNGPGFLEMVSPAYQGKNFYVDEPSVSEKNIITASSTGALLWAKQILARLDVFDEKVLESWYAYFGTGEPHYYFALMNSLENPGMKE